MENATKYAVKANGSELFSIAVIGIINGESVDNGRNLYVTRATTAKNPSGVIMLMPEDITIEAQDYFEGFMDYVKSARLYQMSPYKEGFFNNMKTNRPLHHNDRMYIYNSAASAYNAFARLFNGRKEANKILETLSKQSYTIEKIGEGFEVVLDVEN